MQIEGMKKEIKEHFHISNAKYNSKNIRMYDPEQ